MEAAREQVLDELLGFLGKGEKGFFPHFFFFFPFFSLFQTVPDAVWHAFAFSFGEDGAVAMRFVDSRCVFCYVGRESSRRVFEVCILFIFLLSLQIPLTKFCEILKILFISGES